MMDTFKTFSTLKELCRKIIQNPKDLQSIKEIQDIINCSTPAFMKIAFSSIISIFYPIFISISENKTSYSNNEKQVIVETLKCLFDKSVLENIKLFFNVYAFLLFEIYDPITHTVWNIPEEYKLSIMQCMISIVKSLSSELISNLYKRENAPRLCQMLYVAIELSKNEQLRSLRITSIECIMAIAHVLKDDDFNDIVLRDQIADMFLFFLPGIISGLTQVALVDEKIGHKVPSIAVKAWGRIVTLLMQDYNATDGKLNLLETENVSTHNNTKFKDEKEFKEYLKSKKRTIQWYKDTDLHLQKYFIELTKLTHHSHVKVRQELSEMACLITENCLTTMPSSVSYLIEIVIILSQDDCNEISTQNQTILNNLSTKLNETYLKILLENLEDNFYNCINCLPRKFNGIDENEKIASLNLIIGYISLFGKYNLTRVLLSNTYLDNLMLTLIHISEIERHEISLFEEYTIQELDLTPDLRTPWIQFRFFKEEQIKHKLEQLCCSLGKCGSFRIVSDFLLDRILYNEEHRKEAIFLLNSIVLGVDYNEENFQIIKNIVNTYIDSNYWDIPSRVMIDEYQHEYTLAEIQNNIIQICLLVEGIGKIALSLKEKFKTHLLKLLYSVLDRAGSGHPLIKAAGLSALTNISVACNYSTVTALINDNIDYFTYHVERKLNKLDENEGVLNVLAVVLKYSKIDVLQYIANIINEVLMQSCDKFKEHNATSFLNIFKIFIKRVICWFNVEIKIITLRSKKQKEDEAEHFKVSGIDPNQDFSDDIMGKTPEEMWQEDMTKSKAELMKEIEEPEPEEYKKPIPPLHIRLTVAILGRSLHFLPSKDRIRKLLVLEILNDGLEIIKDWEDELLPIVHQIWSPLVQRFDEFNDPLIINYSFKLLITLAKLSKDFIRMRTSKEALPNILLVLKNSSRDSYLKDKGSSYRYNQMYKLQLTILGNLATVLAELDVIDDDFKKSFDVIYYYLSNKQPIPLQTEALKFFQTIIFYHKPLVEDKMKCWKDDVTEEYRTNVTKINELLLEND